jgi:hypothetical protein
LKINEKEEIEIYYEKEKDLARHPEIVLALFRYFESIKIEANRSIFFPISEEIHRFYLKNLCFFRLLVEH